jgi:cbb3-type cytochrome oxidase subunit 3
MSLRDVVGNMGDTLLVEVALALFFLVFLGIVAYVFVRRKSYWDRISRIPLDEDVPRDGERGES